MVEEKLIYDGYVKIYDVKKEKDGKVEEYTKVHLRGASAGIVINEEGKKLKFKQKGNRKERQKQNMRTKIK